jgi:serine/threonine protein kinase
MSYGLSTTAPAPRGDAPQAPPDPPRCRFEQFLARGGMGKVWRGFDTLLARGVALKVLRERGFADGGFRTRFEEEARHVGRLEHPSIVPVYDLGELPNSQERKGLIDCTARRHTHKLSHEPSTAPKPAPPSQNEPPFGPDDGTVAPWVVVASLPFVPEIVIPTVRHLARLDLGMTRPYGFKPSFNQTFTVEGSPTGWWVTLDHFGIDQGPVALMIENYRSGLIWSPMRRYPPVVAGLRRAGFTGGWR